MPNLTDHQIRETIAGLVAIVERERDELHDSFVVLAEDSPDVGTVTEPEVAIDIALMDSLVAAGRLAVEELDRRAQLAVMAAGGALA